ncbi:LysR family transcriptional regulator [Cupriavidus sp. TA19]|uniref:LysR family transcriptional regulator n=1 Tax=unclassified Cupriavidus TaxID=2640874 RepID=UPI002729485E|nr:LysR family transcriptional regulator [Cupriavidus sp. TA19]GLC92789.1 LysR family transcriptional regulator [Cupriavidus sp. TA19]
MINFRLVRHLWLFLAVAEEEHFGRAAKRLGMSQPPLTEQIQVLEHALKVRLFERSRRGAKLTAAGAAILPAVRKFAEQLERLELAVREAVQGQSGVLTIGAISSAMVETLPALIEHLKAEYPQLTVSVKEIDSVEAVPALEQGDVDLAFARLEGDLGPSIQSIALKQERLAVALPRSHRLAELPRIRLASLAEEAFVIFSRHVSPVYYDSLIATCRAAGFSPRILHEVRTVSSQIAFVGCGQGIALVPASLKKAASDNVVVKPLKEAVNVVTTAMAWSTSRENPMVQAAVAALSAGKIAERKPRRRATAPPAG